MPSLPTYDDVVQAAGRIAGVANRTPVLTSRTVDEKVGILVSGGNIDRAKLSGFLAG
jgi:threonine dehydratase